MLRGFGFPRNHEIEPILVEAMKSTMGGLELSVTSVVGVNLKPLNVASQKSQIPDNENLKIDHHADVIKPLVRVRS